MNRRRLAAALALGALTLPVLSACGDSSSPSPTVAPPQSLVSIPPATEAPQASEPVRAGDTLPGPVRDLADRLNALSDQLSATLSPNAAAIDQAYAAAWKPAVDAGFTLEAVLEDGDPGFGSTAPTTPQATPRLKVTGDGSWCLVDVRALADTQKQGDEDAKSRSALAPFYAAFAGDCSDFLTN